MPDTHQPITFLILDVSRLLRQRFERALDRAGLGVTAGEARALFAVGRAPGRKQSMLAEALNVEPMTLCGYLDRLEAAGLIVRLPDPTDRRAKLIQPTEKATPLIARIESLSQAIRRKATTALSEHQVSEVRDALAIMRTGLIEMEMEPESA
jgi:MarR family transcriptional regulator, transcriptional regulator for hemolysin